MTPFCTSKLKLFFKLLTKFSKTVDTRTYLCYGDNEITAWKPSGKFFFWFPILCFLPSFIGMNSLVWSAVFCTRYLSFFWIPCSITSAIVGICVYFSLRCLLRAIMLSLTEWEQFSLSAQDKINTASMKQKEILFADLGLILAAVLCAILI